MADVRAGRGATWKSAKCRPRLADVDERAPSERLLERHHGRERLVVDVDELERPLGRRFVRPDGRHRIALVAGDVDREHRPIAIRRP